ncbi:hypothetical protein [Aliikangiella sp. G2MR2-5]|uniref:hypothetical protein n=1 Tax=Aliikangiella sp. G2MR2-5 TaxID=2788943 RepID=UPI0018AB2698|nr:hypothetical protein [Aliikangiella sp. G2MR2-5]
MLQRTFLKIIAIAFLSFSTLLMAEILYKIFSNWDDVVEFCDNNHCINVVDIYGNEFPIKRYGVTYDNNDPTRGCYPHKDEYGHVSCPNSPPPREPDN